MQKKSAYVRELLAITEALAKFRHYLLGHKFVIKTDQKSLKSLLDQSLQTPKLQEWLHKFLGYDFTIEYKAGKENVAADSLSRMMMLCWSGPQASILEELKTENMKDNQMQELITKCIQNPAAYPHYTVKEGLLLWKNRLVIPSNDPLVQVILKEFHSTPIGGHAGVTRTLARIRAQFYWTAMKNTIKQFIKECTICQQAKVTHTLPAGLLQPLPIPSQI